MNIFIIILIGTIIIEGWVIYKLLMKIKILFDGIDDCNKILK